MSDFENGGVAINTPWGNTSELRQRRLYPGGGTPPEEVARNQRERLFAAIVAAVSEKGFEATTVADVVSLSGVSRSAFYEHFANKSECLTAAASELGELALRALDSTDANGGQLQPQQAFEGFFGLCAAEPAAARACFVELHVAGARGEEVADRGLDALVCAFEALRDAGGNRHPEAMTLARVLARGLRKLVHSRLGRGEEKALVGLAPELWQWTNAIVPPPRPLQAPRRQRGVARFPFEGYTPAERISSAVAEIVAEKGYGEMSTNDIAARAAISLSTFYAHFADKRDAVVGALEMSGAQITALAVPAARRAENWELGVRALYEAICSYFAAEPAMAHLALVGAYAAGPQARRRRDRAIDPLTAMLAPGFAENPQAPPIAGEAIAATVYALMREQLRSSGPEGLMAVVPLATYITLVGFVGPERAVAVANSPTPRR